MARRKRTEQALRESEDRYRNLFENANDMIMTFTLDGIITGVNRGLEVALGWSREELIGQHYGKLATPVALALADEHTQRALAGEEVSSIFTAEIMSKDGTVVPLEVRARFIRDIAGKPIGVQGIFRDLSERQRIVVSIAPEKKQNRKRIPTSIEGIPIVVEEVPMLKRLSHQGRQYRPVPVGVEILSQVRPALGTLGPHIVRDIADIGTCCQIWSLTAAHVIQPTERLPSSAIGGGVAQVAEWGTVAWIFQVSRCDSASAPNCSSSSPVNDTRINPDVAAIRHYPPDLDPYPKTPPCQGSQSQTRKMQYGPTSWVHGPSGVIRIPNSSNCGTVNCLKVWGVKSDAPLGLLWSTGGTYVIGSPEDPMARYKEGPLDMAFLERNSLAGDSGALVAWNGPNNRQVVGLMNAGFSSVLPFSARYVTYIRADYIKTAFYNAGVSFDHYWGTDATASRPSSTQYDNPC